MPAAATEIIGIALPKAKTLERQAKRIRRNLRISGLMALAARMGADLQVDPAILADDQFRYLIGLAARGFEKAGKPEFAKPACRA